MITARLQIVIFGLTITSSWGNGHATTYRSLVSALTRRGHDVLFFERDMPWYSAHRDLIKPPFGATILYDDLAALHSHWAVAIASADLVIIGSYVPEGIEIVKIVQRLATGLVAFYDIDTPVTLAALQSGSCEYLSEDLIKTFDLYLTFTGGPTLRELEDRWGARKALPLYCAVDPDIYFPTPPADHIWDLGYLGTFSADRQAKVDQLLCLPARCWFEGRFVVAGSLYPEHVHWPENVERIEHLPPNKHRDFYAAQRFTLNITRGEMTKRGWSPSVRLFEAACCGTPIITDAWDGLEDFFEPGKEILTVVRGDDVLTAIRLVPEAQRKEIGAAARARVLRHHTSDHRAAELENYVSEARQASTPPTLA